MKLFPFIGALILSTAPVLAYETMEEVDKACEASREALGMCIGVAGHFSAIAGFSILCRLRDNGSITSDVFNTEYSKLNTEGPIFDFARVFWNSGIEKVLENYPNCPIKPVP